MDIHGSDIVGCPLCYKWAQLTDVLQSSGIFLCFQADFMLLNNIVLATFA
jgi:hypothetical protein